ncbi:MAG: glycosyltransferase family 2 protein [Candidatus Hodarchaeota archaeon]
MTSPQKKLDFQTQLPLFCYGGLIIIALLLVISKDLKSNQKKRFVNSRNEYLYPGLRVGIIIPAYNEEQNIGKTLSLMPRNISDKFEVIVIDDGSSDKTVEIANQFDTTVIRHPKNKGNGAAIQTGLDYCRDNDKEIVLIIDADGQHEPRYIKDFIKPIVEDGYDYVIGNRFRYHYNMRLVKKVASRIMSFVVSFVLRQEISDPTMGFRALSKRVIKLTYFESDYSITLEMLFKIVPYFRTCQIPIKINERVYGQSFIKLKRYFYKTFFSFIKYFLFPKVYRFAYQALRKDLRRKVYLMFKT